MCHVHFYFNVACCIWQWKNSCINAMMLGFLKKKGAYGLFFVSLVFAIYFFWGKRFQEAYRQYQVLQMQREHLEADVKHYRLQIATKRYFIRKLMTDAYFREQVAHEQIDFAKVHEYVIYFHTAESVQEKSSQGKKSF